MASPRRERRFDATWRLPPGVIAAILGAASAAAGGGAPDGHIIYVPLPARVAEGDPLGAHGAASAPLEALIAEHARIGGGDKAHRSGDVVVILTQPDGEPILPDLAAARHAAAADTTNELAVHLRFTALPLERRGARHDLDDLERVLPGGQGHLWTSRLRDHGERTARPQHFRRRALQSEPQRDGAYRP